MSSLVAQQMLWSWSYSAHPPFSFLVLLEEDRRPDALRALQRTWTKLCQDERTALEDTFVDAFLSNMIWPRLCIVREWFMMLDEWEFRVVPSALDADLSKLASCFATTKCVEDVFKILRGFARHSPNSKLERTSRWLCTHTSQVLADYGRQGVSDVPNSFSKSDAKKVIVSKKDFVPDTWAFSLGHDTFEEFGGRPTWPTPSPLSFLQASAASVAWGNADDPWPSMRRAWFAMLVLPGFLLKHTAQAEAWLALQATEYGVLCMRVLQRRVGSKKFLVIPSASAVPVVLKLVQIGEPFGWKAARARLAPPGFVHMQAPLEPIDDAVPETCVLELTDTPKSLLYISALQGFAGLTSHYLAKLCRALAVPAPAKTAPALLGALLGHVCPDLEQARRGEIINNRVNMGKRPPSAAEACSVLLKDGADELVEDVLDREEQEEVNAARRKLLPKIKKPPPEQRAPAAPGEAAVAAGSPSSGGVAEVASAGPPPAVADAAAAEHPLEVPKVRFSGSWTPAQASAWAPPGAQMSRDNSRFYRWVIKMPHLPTPPRSTSLVFGKEMDPARQHASLLHCYKWAWAKHCELVPGAACPHDWDEVHVE